MKRLFSILVIMLVLSCVVALTSCFIGNGGSTTTTTQPNDGPAEEHTHAYAAFVTEPTCTERGYTTFSCSCGANYKLNYVEPTGHTYNSEVTLPTCTEKGYTTYTCTCGDSYIGDYVEIDPNNHTSGEWRVEKAATCTENGTNGKYCIACGEKTDSTVIFSTGHVMSITVIQELSCTEDGIVKHECTVDGCGYFYEITTKAEHNMQLEEKVDATCTSDGHILYRCTKCDYEEITVMYGGHSYTSEITKEPTQSSSGEMMYTCSYCKDSYTEEIPMLKPGIYALLIEDTAPWRTNTNAELLNSLVNRGYIAYWDRISSSKLDSADLSKYGIILIANDQNSATYKNIVANKNNLQIFARDGGVLLYGACDEGWSSGSIGAALLEGIAKGNYYSYRNYIVNADHPVVTGALTDGKSLTNELLYHNYTSHTYFTNLPEGANIILQDANGNPTLVEYEVGSGHVIVSGLTWEHNAKYEYNDKGSYSNTAYDDLIIYATTLINSCEHEYKENGSQEASCTESGYTLYTCDLCGFTYKDNIVKPLGHNVEKWTQAVAPTCTKEGEEIGACSVCGEKQTRKVEAFGHTEGEWIVDREPTCTAVGSQHLTCETCGETISTEAIPTLDHTESEWIVDKEATKTEEGIKHIECTVCGITLKTEAIDTLSSEGLEFILNDDGVSYSVTGIGTCTDTDIVIPATYKGLPVTSIGDRAFESSYVVRVEIPNSVISIGDYAFYWCKYLLTVVMPNSVTSIGTGAFYNCSNFQNIVLSNSLTSIGTAAFYNCALKSLLIPDSVISISTGAFKDCELLTNVTIGKSLSNISYLTFDSCDSLLSIDVDENNEYYSSIDGNLYTKDGKKLIQYAIGKVDISFTIPNLVTSVESSAFQGCTSLTSVIIPNYVTSISNYAFSGCKSLTIYCEAESKPDEWNNNWNPDNRPVVWGYKMPSDGLEYSLNEDGQSYSVTGIGTCTDTDIIIPEKHEGLPVTSIGDYAFDGCDSLTSIIIPDSVTSIGALAFASCDSLTSIEIGDSVTSIGALAFASCDSLTSIEIPDSVISIGEGAFSDCESLIYVDISDSITCIESDTFSSCVSLKNIDIPVGVTVIGSSAFWRCGSLENVTFPESLVSIGYSAFYYCESLKNIVFPNELATIGGWAFEGCDSLSNVVIPASVTRIDVAPFRDCIKLTSIEVHADNNYYMSIDGNLYSKDGKSFMQYASGKEDTSFIVPSFVTKITSSAFERCYSLDEVVIPNSVVTIDSYAFRYTNCTIYCAFKEQPDGWSVRWNYLGGPAVWGYKNDTQGNGEYKLGLGVSFGEFSSSQINATAATVVLDGEGKIVACRIDAIQNKFEFVDDEICFTNFQTKRELGYNYGLSTYGAVWGFDPNGDGITLEWFQQAEAFEKYVVGKTVDEIEKMPTQVTNYGYCITADDELLNAGCTIGITEFKDAVIKACKDSQGMSFEVTEGFILGLAINSRDDGSHSDEDGYTVYTHSEIAATVVSDGKILSSLNDAMQPSVVVDYDGKLIEYSVRKDAGVLKTKRELKEDYMMSMWGYSLIGNSKVKEWYIQSAEFSKYVVGMTVSELRAMPLQTVNSYVISDDDDLLNAGCTIDISDMKEVVIESVVNAR